MKHLYLIILLLFNYQLVSAQKASSNSGNTISLLDQQTLNSLKPPCPNGTFDLPFTLIGDFPSNQQIVAKMEQNGTVITVGKGTTSPIKITIPQWFDVANVWVETVDGSIISSKRTLAINSVDKNNVPKLLPSLESELISKTNFSDATR